MTLPRQRGLTEQAATTAIDTACRLLRLPSIRNEFSDIADRALKDQMTYRGFLAELLTAECDDRSRRRSERRIKAAGFPRDKSLRTFDFDANPNIDAAAIHTLASCEWIKKSQPLCLIGDSGTGKSHILIALGTEAAMAGYRVKYVLATKLVNELVEAADEKQLTKTIARYGRVDLLCIDELGYMELDRRGAEDRALAELIGSLLLQSRDFATLWSKHPVRDCTVGTKALHHPVVGPLTLDFENVHLTDGTGHRMLLYTAPRSSPSDAALRLLSSLTAEGGGLGYEAAPQAVTRLARITDTGG